MKKISAVLLFLMFFVFTGCESESETAFREWLTKDFESILECENNIYASYSVCLDSLSLYCEEPSEETKEAFFSAVEAHRTNMEENLYPESYIDEDTYGIMEEYNIPIDDYKWLFNNYADTRKEYDNFNTAEGFAADDNTEGAEKAEKYLRVWFDWSRKYMVYSMMDMVAESGDSNISYFKDTVNKYSFIMPEETEWLNDRNRIFEGLDLFDSEYVEARNEFLEYVNEIKADESKQAKP